MDFKRRTAMIGSLWALCAGFAHAQAPERVHRVAHAVFRVDMPGAFYDTVRDRLSERGFVQGRNLDFRFFSFRKGEATSAEEANRRLIEEVLAWRPDVILVGTAATTRLVQRATTSVPIVFANLQDPQIAGIVQSLARPGGNTTGAAQHYDTLSIKRVELARELLPAARRIVIAIDRRGGGIPPASRQALEKAAREVDLTITELDIARIEGGLCGAAASAVEARAEAILPWGNIEAPANYASDRPWGAHGYGECLARLQRQSRIPVIDDSLDTVKQGSVLALGEDQHDSYRRAADVIARLLSGAKPATTPVDVSMHVQLFINRSSVAVLGLNLPPAIRLRADRVLD